MKEKTGVCNHLVDKNIVCPNMWPKKKIRRAMFCSTFGEKKQILLLMQKMNKCAQEARPCHSWQKIISVWTVKPCRFSSGTKQFCHNYINAIIHINFHITCTPVASKIIPSGANVVPVTAYSLVIGPRCTDWTTQT